MVYVSTLNTYLHTRTMYSFVHYYENIIEVIFILPFSCYAQDTSHMLEAFALLICLRLVK
jgi:hypothetical protein